MPNLGRRSSGCCDYRPRPPESQALDAGVRIALTPDARRALPTAVAVLFDDALGDLQDRLVVVRCCLAQEAFGLLGGATLAHHQQAAGQVDLGVVVGVALRFFDDGTGGGELR